jgi:uncharacterized membrane protein
MQNPPPGSYPPGSYPPPQHQAPGGFQPGGYPPGPPAGKTKTLNLDYNVAAGLGYLPICLINPILPIVMLVTEPKENKFVRFHAMQALFLLGGYIVGIIAVMVVGAIITVVAATISESLGAILGLLVALLYFVVIIAFLVLSVIGIIKGWGGQIWRAPIVGSIADKNS